MIAALLLLMLLSSALGEGTVLQAYSNPDVPAPFVPEHEPEGDDYFSDAVFIGDSMMEQWEVSGLLPTTNFVWKVGMSAMSVHRKQFRAAGVSGKLTTYEYAARYNPKKIYVWLGGNGLDKKVSNNVLADYETLADELIEHFPNALIYVISPPPMTRKRMAKEDKLTPGRYSAFESKLRELAARRNFYYIDGYHAIAGEDGYMPVQFTTGDGYHVNRAAITLLTDLVRAQTVPYPTTEENPQ